jgi:hypothetical protein
MIYKNGKKKVIAPSVKLNKDGSKQVVVQKPMSDPTKVVNKYGDNIYTTDPNALYDLNDNQIGTLNGGLFVDANNTPIAAPSGSRLTDITNEDDPSWNGTTRTYKDTEGKIYTV